MSPTDRCRWCGHFKLDHFTHPRFPEQLECHIKGCICMAYQVAPRPGRLLGRGARSAVHKDQTKLFDPEEM